MFVTFVAKLYCDCLQWGDRDCDLECELEVVDFRVLFYSFNYQIMLKGLRL